MRHRNNAIDDPTHPQRGKHISPIFALPERLNPPESEDSPSLFFRLMLLVAGYIFLCLFILIAMLIPQKRRIIPQRSRRASFSCSRSLNAAEIRKTLRLFASMRIC